MGLIDSKTGEAWPIEMANLKLQEIRQECREDLWALDERRGVTGLKVTDTIADPEDKEGLGKTKDVVNEQKRAAAHTGDDLTRLLAKRWAEYCSEPRDLAEFIATTRLPKQQELEALTEAASHIEDAIANELADAPATNYAPAAVFDVEKPTATATAKKSKKG